MVRESESLPLATVGGILVILIFCSFTLASAAQYPGAFSPMDNWLSDLGTALKNPAGDVYFNVGSILGGIALLFTVIGLGIWKDGKNDRLLLAGRACGAICALALMLIGVFHEGTSYHSMIAFTFFAMLALFLALTSAALWKNPAYGRWLGYYSALVIILDIWFVITFIIYEHAPIWEWIAVFGGLLWVGLLAYRTLRL